MEKYILMAVIAIYLKDKDYKILEVSLAICAVLGLSMNGIFDLITLLAKT